MDSLEETDSQEILVLLVSLEVLVALVSLEVLDPEV